MRSAVSPLVLLACGSAGFAYSPVPLSSYVKPTPNGKFVLVMLLPADAGNERNEARKRYTQSGLYTADDPTSPVWACDWRADHKENVTVSEDGVFAVRVADTDAGGKTWRKLSLPDYKAPPKRAGVGNEPAVWVYKNGQLHRTFTAGELFDCRRLTDDDCDGGPVVNIDGFRDADGRVTVKVHGEKGTQSADVGFRDGTVSGRQNGAGVSDCGSGLKCGTPSPGDWVWVVGIGLAVVSAGGAAVAGLAFVLIRGQRK